jgi:hypothetical protein
MKPLIIVAIAFVITLALLIVIDVIAHVRTAHAQTDCYPISPSGEGFPRVQCTDGSIWYQDMDGIDGALGTQGDGEWKEEARP